MMPSSLKRSRHSRTNVHEQSVDRHRCSGGYLKNEEIRSPTKLLVLYNSLPLSCPRVVPRRGIAPKEAAPPEMNGGGGGNCSTSTVGSPKSVRARGFGGGGGATDGRVMVERMVDAPRVGGGGGAGRCGVFLVKLV